MRGPAVANDVGASVWLIKVKRPAGEFRYRLHQWAQDDHGTWLFGPTGSDWSAPHTEGRLPVDVLVLLAPKRPYVAWWVADPDDRRIELDVCLPPTATETGWTYVDLELDPVRHEDGPRVEIEDWDEFHDAVTSGHMSSRDAERAARTAVALAEELTDNGTAWMLTGWRHLHRASAGSPSP